MLKSKKKDSTKEKVDGEVSSKRTTTVVEKSSSKNVQSQFSHTTHFSSYSSETKNVSSGSFSSNFSSPGPSSSITPDLSKLLLSSSPNLSNSTPRASISNAKFKPRSISLFETDARPIGTIGPVETLGQSSFTPNYQSPFSRVYSSQQPTSTVRYITSNNPSTVASYNRNVRPTTSTTPSPSVAQSATNNVVPTYGSSGRRRGNVVIINNIKFLEKKEDRKGAEIDEKDVSKLFSDMGFEVKVHRNLKSQEMKNKIKKFSSTLKNMDISVVIMMSHGNNKNEKDQVLPGNFTKIFGTDGIGLPIDDVLAEFSTDKCPGMKGKPKIFIFQCCRGDQEETIHVDAAPIRNVIKTHADMLIAYSTLPGFYSIRDPVKGSWYIQSICEVFRKHANDFDVETLLKIVDDQLSKKHPKYTQTSTYESRGFKRCFLNLI